VNTTTAPSLEPADEIMSANANVSPVDAHTAAVAYATANNQLQMLDEGKPDLVIAFPGGGGTADMMRRARAAGVEVLEVSPKERDS
jgi:hypothetical protein